MPFLSIVRSPALVRRRLTQRFSLSTQKRRRCRFGRNRRGVLLFACETWWPTIGALPVTWQTRAIARSLFVIRLVPALGGRWRPKRCSKADYYPPKSGLDQPLRKSPPSQQPALRERDDIRAGHDEMVEGPDVDQRQRLLQCLGQQLVGARGLGGAGRVVVREDDRGRIVAERGLHNLARIDAGLRQRTLEQFLGRDQPVLAVEEQPDEDLDRPRRDRQPEVVAHDVRGRQGVAARDILAQRAARDLDA